MLLWKTYKIPLTMSSMILSSKYVNYDFLVCFQAAKRILSSEGKQEEWWVMIVRNSLTLYEYKYLSMIDLANLYLCSVPTKPLSEDANALPLKWNASTVVSSDHLKKPVLYYVWKCSTHLLDNNIRNYFPYLKLFFN